MRHVIRVGSCDKVCHPLLLPLFGLGLWVLELLVEPLHYYHPLSLPPFLPPSLFPSSSLPPSPSLSSSCPPTWSTPATDLAAPAAAAVWTRSSMMPSGETHRPSPSSLLPLPPPPPSSLTLLPLLPPSSLSLLSPLVACSTTGRACT